MIYKDITYISLLQMYIIYMILHIIYMILYIYDIYMIYMIIYNIWYIIYIFTYKAYVCVTTLNNDKMLEGNICKWFILEASYFLVYSRWTMNISEWMASSSACLMFWTWSAKQSKELSSQHIPYPHSQFFIFTTVVY